MYNVSRPVPSTNEWMAAIGTGWKLFWQKPLLWIWMTFLVEIIPTLLILFLSFAFLFPLAFAESALVSSYPYADTYPTDTALSAGGILVVILTLALAFVFSRLLSGYLLVGLFHAALVHVRTRRVSSSDMFPPSHYILSYGWGSLFVALILYVCMLCFFVPSVLVGTLLLFSLPIMADRRFGISRSISTSVSMVSPYYLQALLFFFVLMVINLAGLLAFGLGILVTIPWSILSIASMYNRLSGAVRTVAADGAPPVIPSLPGSAAAPPPVARTPTRIVVLNGANAGAQFYLQGSLVTIGRGCNVDVQLDADPTVSRRHARLEKQGSQWILIDEGSLNGSYVNGQPVQQKVIQVGDILRLGNTEMRVE